MAKSGDRDLALAKVYAASMLQAAATPQQEDALAGELTELADLLDSGTELAGFLLAPSLDVEMRSRALEKMFRGKCSDLFVDSLQVIHRKGRFELLRSVIDAYQHLLEEKRGRVEVQVSTAAALPESQRERLRAWAAEYTGKTPKLIESVEPELLGGVVVRIGDQKFDQSVSRHLNLMQAKLKDRASRELHAASRAVTS